MMKFFNLKITIKKMKKNIHILASVSTLNINFAYTLEMNN
jgi:hypothetical protein